MNPPVLVSSSLQMPSSPRVCFSKMVSSRSKCPPSKPNLFTKSLYNEHTLLSLSIRWNQSWEIDSLSKPSANKNSLDTEPGFQAVEHLLGRLEDGLVT